MPARRDALKKQQLADMRAAGMSVTEIAAATGRTRNAVHKANAKFGLVVRVSMPERSPKKPRVQLVKAREQVAQAAPVAARSWFEV